MTDTRDGHPSVWLRVNQHLKNPSPEHPWEQPYAFAFVACWLWALAAVALPWVNYGLAVEGFTVSSDLTADARMVEEQSVQAMQEVARALALLLSVISAILGACGLILLWPAANTAQAALLRIQRWRKLIALNGTLLVTTVTLLLAMGDLNIAAPLLTIVLMCAVPLVLWFVPFALETWIEAPESPTAS